MPQVGIKNDAGKRDWTLMPWEQLEEVVKVLEDGAKKYDRNNWKLVEPERYRKALLRHAVTYAEGGKVDKESGLLTLAHLICNALFLLYFENGSYIEDQIDEAFKCITHRKNCDEAVKDSGGGIMINTDGEWKTEVPFPPYPEGGEKFGPGAVLTGESIYTEAPNEDSI